MQKRVLITDVDNTLLDWQDLWYQTFSAMIGKVIEISSIAPETLYAECSVIHQKYGTSEYSRLLSGGSCPLSKSCTVTMFSQVHGACHR